MSENCVLTTGESETIMGSYAAAKSYLGGMRFAEPFKSWIGLTDVDVQKSTLITAVRYFNAQVWDTAHDTFAERDASDEFKNAQYIYAAMIYADQTLLAKADQGSNIKALSADGGGSVEYFNPTNVGAPVLPVAIMRLVGQYLATPSTSGPVAGGGRSGSCVNPLSQCADFERKEPF